MDDLTRPASAGPEPFNSPVEVGLRALAVLTASHPVAHGLQRLTVLDYLVVHSDDVPDGPPGLHPQTPYRAGELLLRRGVLEQACCSTRAGAWSSAALSPRVSSTRPAALPGGFGPRFARRRSADP